MYVNRTGPTDAKHRRRAPARRGVAALLAMLFMVLFTAMALGFYAEVNMAAQVSGNDRRAAEARVAAETGVAFMRYHLASVAIPPGLTADAKFEELEQQLQGRLETTGNLGTNHLGWYVDADPTKDLISIPSADPTQFIDLGLGTGQKFRATIGRSGKQIVLRVVGASGATTASSRGIEVKLDRVDNDATVFGYGVATKGQLSLAGGGVVNGSPDASRGSILDTATTNPVLTLSGGAVISGKVDLTSATGTVSGSGSIGGTTITTAWPVKKGVTAPEFPTVNPEDFINYMATRQTWITTATNTNATYSNIRIKAGVNPTFSSHSTISGVVLIDAPNQVSFSGGTNIIGVIVVSNPTEGTSTNSITFSGGSTLTGPENLPVATYGELTTMTGGSILAPNFSLALSGGTTSFGGSIITKGVTVSGGAIGATYGSVISVGTGPSTWSGGGGFTLTNAGASQTPAGVEFTSHYSQARKSYLEFVP